MKYPKWFALLLGCSLTAMPGIAIAQPSSPSAKPAAQKPIIPLKPNPLNATQSISPWTRATLLKTLSANQAIHAAAISGDGKTLVVGGRGNLQVWNLPSGQSKLLIFPEIEKIGLLPLVHSVAISPNGKILMTATNPSIISSVEKIDKPGGCTSNNFGMSCSMGSSSTNRSISFKPEGAVQVWDLTTGEQRSTLSVGGYEHQVNFSPKGNMLVDVSSTTVNFWNTSTSKLIPGAPELKRSASCQQAVAFSPDSQLVAMPPVEGGQGDVLVADFRAGQSQVLTIAEAKNSNSKAASADAVLAAYLASNGGCLSFSPDGKLLALNLVGNVIVWQRSNGKQLHRLVDEKTISNINLRQATKEDIEKYVTESIARHWKVKQAIAFSPDSRILATSTPDGTIKLWDSQTGKQIVALLGHTAIQPKTEFELDDPPTISLLRFSDDKTLISVGGDGKIKVWGLP